MRKWFTKRNIIIVISVLLAVYLISSISIVSKNFNGIRYWLGDDKNYENVQLKIKGVLLTNIWTGHRQFYGSMTIDGKEYNRIKFDYKETEPGYLLYYIAEDEYYAGYGNICTDNVKDGLALEVFTENEDGKRGWNNETGLMIAAPAKNLEEAIKLSEELMERHKYSLN